MKSCISRSGRHWLLAACLVLACLLPVGAQTVRAASGPVYVPNEYIIRVQPNTSYATVEQAVAQLGGTVVKAVSLDNAYLVRMGTTKGGGGLTAYRASVSGATAPWVVTDFTPNARCQATGAVIPDDALWGDLWGMVMIHMPQAWAIQKGSSGVTVGVIDSGVAKHPELVNRIVPGYDFVENDADATNDMFGHGTHVSGTIAAQGDDIGVVGVCWDGVQIMPIRVLGDDGSGTLDWLLSGLDWAMNHNVDAVNMSLGFSGSSGIPILQLKLQQLAQRGIIMCAAAGNDGWNVGPPAMYDETICVGALDPNEAITSYSNFGPGYEVDIAAPGGDLYQGESAGIESTWVTWAGNTPVYSYAFEMGTSMATPHVTGAAALLLSAGIPPSEVRSRLQTTARAPKSGTMDKRKYGSGILDVNAALSNGSILLVKPAKGSTVNPYPDFKVNVRGIDPTTIAVYLDYADGNGDGLPDNIANETPVLAGVAASGYLNASQTAIVFNWADISPGVPISSGFHFVYVTARTTVGDEAISDWGTFNVASKIIPAGQHLFAFPYQFANTNPDGTVAVINLPSDVLLDAGTSQPLDFRLQASDRARLIRWSAPQAYYVSYVTGLLDPALNTPRFDDRAWLNPVTKMLLPTGAVQAVPTAGGYLPDDVTGSLQFPAGTGFWLILQKDAVITDSVNEVNAPQGFKIPLYRGWNLIGNPFTHDIPLAAVRLLYQGSVRTLDEDRLSARPWVDSNFYGYVSGSGYELVPPDKRLFEPYKGYWVRANYGGISPQDTLYMLVQ